MITLTKQDPNLGKSLLPVSITTIYTYTNGLKADSTSRAKKFVKSIPDILNQKVAQEPDTSISISSLDINNQAIPQSWKTAAKNPAHPIIINVPIYKGDTKKLFKVLKKISAYRNANNLVNTKPRTKKGILKRSLKKVLTGPNVVVRGPGGAPVNK